MRTFAKFLIGVASYLDEAGQWLFGKHPQPHPRERPRPPRHRGAK